jgi:hypothetical protein
MEEMSKFQRWYNKNKQALNAKRKQKYATDPIYREKVLASQHERNKARSQQRQYRETVLGQVVRAYSVGEAALLIQRRVQTLTLWEQKGVIPLPIFPAPRAYTHHQIMLIRELVYIVTKAWVRRINNGKIKAEIEAQRAKIFAHWYELPDALQN